jgi:hypothetical protein
VFRRLLRIAGLAALYATPAGAAQAQRVAELQFAPPFLRMVPDAQVQASATAYDSTGTPMVVHLRWSSSNINVATVSENGLVRGVAPGTALIVAVIDGQRGGRRRAMQVQVMSRGGGTRGATAPMPPSAPSMAPAGAVPPAAPVPGLPPPAAPPMVYVSPRGIDSTIKAAINCSEPMLNAANPLQACYDQRPTPRVSPPAPVAPCPDQPSGISTGVLVMVRVNDAGAVIEAMPFVRAGCPELVHAAVQAARAMSFNPALKDGRPVAAWARLFIRTTEPPPKQ